MKEMYLYCIWYKHKPNSFSFSIIVIFCICTMLCLNWPIRLLHFWSINNLYTPRVVYKLLYTLFWSYDFQCCSNQFGRIAVLCVCFLQISKFNITNMKFKMAILSLSWFGPPRHINNFAILCSIRMELAPIDLACKRGFYI